MPTISRSAVLVSAMAIVVLASTLPAQRAGQAALPPVDPAIVAGIGTGDLSAIVLAGESRNPEYIKYVEPLLRDARFQGSRSVGARNSLRIALARLGNPQQLREFWCEAIEVSPHPPVTWFGSIGGWYSIRALRAILDGAGHENWAKAVRDEPGDISYLSPRALAVDVLPKVVPDPPVLNTPERDTNKEVTAWRTWIDEHEDSLRLLRPTGEGIDLSESACRNGRPVRR